MVLTSKSLTNPHMPLERTCLAPRMEYVGNQAFLKSYRGTHVHARSRIVLYELLT